jgi:hypothetical protein
MSKILKYNNFINEGKTSELIDKYKHLPKDDISYLIEISRGSPHYLNWLFKVYDKEKDNYELDNSGLNTLISVLDSYLLKFINLKGNLKYSDINQIKTLGELKEIIDKYYNYDKLLEGDSVILYSDDEWIYFIPKRYEVAKEYGYSKFCTSRDKDLFELYNVKDSALVYILHKFDHTKNYVLEQCEPNGFKLWDYMDNYDTFGDLESVEKKFIYDNGENFHFDEIDIPRLTLGDFKKHYIEIVKEDGLEEELLDAFEVDIDDVKEDEIFEIKQFLESY